MKRKFTPETVVALPARQFNSCWSAFLILPHLSKGQSTFPKRPLYTASCWSVRRDFNSLEKYDNHPHSSATFSQPILSVIYPAAGYFLVYIYSYHRHAFSLSTLHVSQSGTPTYIQSVYKMTDNMVIYSYYTIFNTDKISINSVFVIKFNLRILKKCVWKFILFLKI